MLYSILDIALAIILAMFLLAVVLTLLLCMKIFMLWLKDMYRGFDEL